MPQGLDGSPSSHLKTKRKRSNPKEQSAKKQTRVISNENKNKNQSSIPMTVKNEQDIKKSSQTGEDTNKVSEHHESCDDLSIASCSPPKNSKSKRQSRRGEPSTSARDSASLNDIESLMFSIPGIMGAIPPRIKKAIDALSSSKANQVLKSLEELNDFMMMSCDDLAYRIRVDELVPLLVRHMDSLEISGPGDDPLRRAVLCSQMLSVLLDSSPAACQVLAKSEKFLGIICGHIASVRLVELSDQCVVILSRLSKDFQRQLIVAGALNAVLAVVDFFCMSTQRQCLQIASDLASIEESDLSQDEIRMYIRPVLPRLADLVLTHSDEKASICWRYGIAMCASLSLSDKDILAPILDASSKPITSSHVLEGLALIASKSFELSNLITGSLQFVNRTILEPLETSADSQLIQSLLQLVSSLLPPIKFSVNGQLVSTDPLVPTQALLVDQIHRLVLNKHNERHEFVLLFSLQLVLSGKSAFFRDDESQLSTAVIQLLTSGTSSVDQIVGALALIDLVPIKDPSLTSVLKNFKKRIVGRGKKNSKLVRELIDKLLMTRFDSGKRATPLKWTSLENLLALARTGSFTDYELFNSDCLDKLERLLTSPKTCDDLRTLVLDVVEKDEAGTDKLISYLTSLVDQHTQTGSVSQSSIDIVNSCLQRPVRLIVTHDGRAVSMLVDPLTPLASLGRFLDHQDLLEEDGEDAYDDFENDILSDEEDEEEVVLCPSVGRMIVALNGKEFPDQSLSVLEAVAGISESEGPPTVRCESRVLNFQLVTGQTLNFLDSRENGTSDNLSSIPTSLMNVWAKPHTVTLVPRQEEEGPTTAEEPAAVSMGGIFIAKNLDEVIFSDLQRVIKEKSDNKIVQLLRLLMTASRRRVVCPKTSSVLAKSLAVTGYYPSWTNDVVSIVSLEAKRQLIQSKFLGIQRAVSNRFASLSITSIPRQKLGINRDHIVVSALVMMAKFAHVKQAILEVAFLGEEGTGSGPTNEFYSLAIDQLGSGHNGVMFRSCPDGSLFPSVLMVKESDVDSANRTFQSHQLFCQTSSSVDQVLVQWRLLGLIVGRAILDSRLVDIDMHPLFWEMARQVAFGEPVIVGEHLLHQIDSTLLQSLKAMEKITDEDLEALDVDASVLPGHEQYRLSSESYKIVTRSQLADFKFNIIRAHLYDGIIHQIKEFVAGFTQVISREILSVVHPTEMRSILAGASLSNDQWWMSDVLVRAIKADHGYSLTSPQILNLVEIMSQLSLEDRLRFVRFVTGSRTLPRDGFGGLKPHLTVVKAVKGPEEGPPDSFLPSVMTCANFLKVPEYSSKEIMRIQLLKAISEGQDSFLLS